MLEKPHRQAARVVDVGLDSCLGHMRRERQLQVQLAHKLGGMVATLRFLLLELLQPLAALGERLLGSPVG